jgi:hypothetical protein
LPEEIGEFSVELCSLEAGTTGANSGLSLATLNRNLDQSLPFAGNSLRTHLVLRVLRI